MKLKDLPQPIRELAEKRVREQGNEPDGEKDLTNDKQIGGFDWHKTQEGDYFWEEISKSNFTPFYERYPQSKQYTLEQLREEKIAVLVENEEQAKKLGIKVPLTRFGYYWTLHYGNQLSPKEAEDYIRINFSQVIIPEAKQEPANEVQPPHYKQTTIEPIAVIQDWKLSFCLGNVIKYIGRADYKGNKLADLEKAADYLRMEIETLKTK